jgi:hypothetical protein
VRFAACGHESVLGEHEGEFCFEIAEIVVLVEGRGEREFCIACALRETCCLETLARPWGATRNAHYRANAH